VNDLNQQVSEALDSRRSELATRMVAREFVRRPELEARYGKAGRGKCLQDAGYHLAYLAQAIACNSHALFADYIGWAKVMLTKRGIPAIDLEGLLENMQESLQAMLPPDFSDLACGYLDAALRQLPHLPEDVPSYISEGTPLAAQYLKALLRGDRHLASKLVLDAVQHGTPVRDIYLQVFECTQHEIGRLWQVNQISVAQEHYCTGATQQIMSQLYPYIFGAAKTGGTLVATCITGDFHEMGIRMLCDFFEMDGWRTYYLGADVPAKDIIQTVVKNNANVLAISATITYHVRGVESLIAAVRRTPECSGVKVLVGGYPFKVVPDLWMRIGADGSAAGAQEAVTVADRLTNQSAHGTSPLEPNSTIALLRDSSAPVFKGAHDLTNPGSVGGNQPTPAAEALKRRDDDLYEELSRANNELINAQREMARKNAELAAARKKLEASEQRYLNLSACSPVGILEMDATGRCLYSNPQWGTITGLAAVESLGEGWLRALESGDAPAFLAAWNLALRTGLEFSREFRLLTTSLERRWAKIRCQSMRNESGIVMGYVSTVADISARKYAEEELRQSEDQLRAMFDLASVGIAQADPRTRQWLRVNKKFCEITGYTAGELLQMHTPDLTHPDDRMADGQALQRVVLGEVPDYRMEKRYIRKNGALVWVNVNVTVLRDAAGEPTRTMAAIEDITEHRRIEAQLFQSQKLESVGTLAGGVAHQFNSFLTAIMGRSEVLVAELPAGSPLIEHATEIIQVAERAAALTRQLLAYGRKQFLQPVVLDLNRLIADMEVLLRPLAGANVDVRFVPAKILHGVKADVGELEQVIVNMVINARDAMPDGGKLALETADVLLGPESAERGADLKPGDYVMLAITDTGTGMREEVKARIFEPFYTTKGIGQGVGLGLSACYGIIKQSGGHISVESEPGRGTTFKIYLPQAEPETRQTRLAEGLNN
jgi:PAS domain S-box-containing protein